MEAFDLYSPAIDADPFPYYAVLREQYPCYWSEGAGLFILSRYHDVAQAALDWQTYSSSQGNMIDELPGRAGATLGTTDPPRHDRLRALSQAAFAKRNIEHLAAPTVAIADRSLDRICEQKHFDFVADFSSQITVGLLFRTMGLPERDHAEIRRKVILAVSTDKGLMVPVIRDCDRLGMADIEKAIADAAKRAREGKITLDDLEGGVFTITNGGIFGSMLSTPILNAPQSAILGLHAINERPVAVNGQVVIRPMMYLALSYDHRLVDGKEAVTFLVKIKQAIEDPARLLLGV